MSCPMPIGYRKLQERCFPFRPTTSSHKQETTQATTATMSVSLTTSAQYNNWPRSETKDDFFSMASLRATSSVADETRKAVDIMVVMDRSGSMSGSKLRLCLQTVEFLTRELSATDRLGLVSYDTSIRTDFGLLRMDKMGKERVASILKNIRAGSATNLSGGLLQGIEELQKPSDGPPNEIQSILLLTDGMANHGLTKTGLIVNAMKEALIPIPTASVFAFGYGGDHDQDMLRSISDNGRGVYYYVKELDDIPVAFADCLGGLLSVVAQSIRVTFEAVSSSTTIKKIHSKFTTEVVEEGRKYELRLGDMYAEEDRDIVAELRLGLAAEGVSHAMLSNATAYAAATTTTATSTTSPATSPVSPQETKRRSILERISGVFFRQSSKSNVEKEDNVDKARKESTAADEENATADEEKATEEVAEEVADSEEPGSAAVAEEEVKVNVTTEEQVEQEEVGEPLIRVTMEYIDVMAGAPVTAVSTLRVGRPLEVDALQNQPNRAIVAQQNRITVATTMDAAKEASDRGDFTSAKAVLQRAREDIRGNYAAAMALDDSGDDEAEEEMCGAFCEELEAVENLCSSAAYAHQGKYMMSTRAQTHHMQRSNESSAAPMMKKGYRKAKKMSMISKVRS